MLMFLSACDEPTSVKRETAATGTTERTQKPQKTSLTMLTRVETGVGRIKRRWGGSPSGLAKASLPSMNARQENRDTGARDDA
jgi:hypothetical protein